MATITPIISVPELEGINGLQWIRADQSSTETTKTTILTGKANKQTLFNNDVLDSLSGDRIGEYGFYGGHTIKYGAGEFDVITLTAVELIVDYNKSGYYSRFEALARTESRPLEEKNTQLGANDETYATWWNHRVVSSNKDETITEADWKAVTDNKIPSAYAGTTAQWAKTNQAVKGQYTIMDARFPGVQSYGVPFEQVKEIVYSRSKAVIDDIIRAVGQLRVPKDSAGTYYDDSRTDYLTWLVTAASFRRRLGWYEAELTYAYAKGGWLSKDAVSPATGVYPKYVNL